jgi:hypothetical protein
LPRSTPPNIANGKDYGLCLQKHRHQSWLKFLRMIDLTVSADRDIYLICDNYELYRADEIIGKHLSIF